MFCGTLPMIRLTRHQVREIDRRAIHQYGIPGIVLMENAARSVCNAACDLLGGDCIGQVLILCGGGNNGGDGLAVARHLHNAGSDVIVALTVDPALYRGDAAINWHIVRNMNLPVIRANPKLLARPAPMLLIDAVFGTGLSRPVDEPFTRLADAVNASDSAVLAVDVPSGLDCDTGRPLGACIKADRTVTFIAEKVGFAEPQAAKYLGQIVVGDIGCPKELIEQVMSEAETGNVKTWRYT
jgi:NAD(P)H-hydrate epimerase